MKDGGSIYPAKVFSHFEDDGLAIYTMSSGLTMRDWFAGLAMQGIIQAAPKMPDDVIARQAYGLADAMLKAREVHE